MKTLRHIGFFLALVLFAICSLVVIQNKVPGKGVLKFKTNYSDQAHETFKTPTSANGLVSSFATDVFYSYAGLRLNSNSSLFYLT
jgi:hypothetical protein